MTDIGIKNNNNIIAGGGFLLWQNTSSPRIRKRSPNKICWIHFFSLLLQALKLWVKYSTSNRNAVYWIDIIYNFCIFSFVTFWLCHIYVRLTNERLHLIKWQNIPTMLGFLTVRSPTNANSHHLIRVWPICTIKQKRNLDTELELPRFASLEKSDRYETLSFI